MDSVHISCRGRAPASKGSYKAIWGKNKAGEKVTRLVPMDKKEAPWRKWVVNHIDYPGPAPFIGKKYFVIVRATYYLLRPNAVLESNRKYPTVKPDIDKLARAFHDALTDSGLIADDSQIISMNEDKKYVDTLPECGVEATITWEVNH